MFKSLENKVIIKYIICLNVINIWFENNSKNKFLINENIIQNNQKRFSYH